MTRQLLPSAGSLGRLSLLHRYYSLLRLLAAPPAPHRLSLCSAVPVPPLPTSQETDEVSQVPGKPSCAYAALSDPGRTFTPSPEDDRGNGELPLTGGFRPRPMPLPVPHSVPGRCLAASWRAGTAPALQNDEGSSINFAFGALSRGLDARCLRFAGRLATAPRKTRLQPVANPCCTGLVTRRAPNEVSATWHPPHPGFLAQFEFKVPVAMRSGLSGAPRKRQALRHHGQRRPHYRRPVHVHARVHADDVAGGEGLPDVFAL